MRHLTEFVKHSNYLLQGKEVAVNIKKLPEGTVIFDDVALEKRRGKILKTLKSPHGRRQSDPLAGRIVYETVKGYLIILVFNFLQNSEKYHGSELCFVHASVKQDFEMIVLLCLR